MTPLLKNILDGETKYSDLEQKIVDIYCSKLGTPDQRQVDVFKSYCKMLSFAFHKPKLDTILEIGCGYSTVLLAELAHSRRSKFYSLDMYPENLLNQLKETSFYDIVKKNVRFLKGSSISKKEFQSFYDGSNKKSLAGITAENIKKVYGNFVKEEFGLRKWAKLKEVLRSENIDLDSVFFPGNSLFLPKEVLKVFSLKGDEFDYFKEHDVKEGLLVKLKRQVRYFDLIFFDSGEFSSILEWIILKNSIVRGGIAVS